MRQILEHDWFPRPMPANVVLGERSWCYSSFSCLHFNSKLPCAVRVGHDSGIYHGTFFDLGPEAQVEIGNFCTLVGAIISTNGRIVINDYAFIAHEVVLADSFAASPFVEQKVEEQQPSVDRSRPIIGLGENCWIGARAVLLAGAFIGEGAIVGAACLVDFEVPPYSIVAGNPARIAGEVKKQICPAPAGQIFD